MAGAVIRILAGEIDFTPYLREHIVPVYTADQSSLIDINLSLYILPSYYEWIPGRELLGCEDIRLYISGFDVSSSLKKEIKRLISAMPPDVISQAYLRGAKAHLQYVSGLGMYPAEVQRDQKFATTYAADPNWAAKFDTLGDRKIGWMGNLHPLSFLFRFIPLPLISIENVWDDYQQSVNKPVTPLANLTPLVLTFSQGPAPSLEVADYKSVLPAGRLVYQLELVLKNPLEAPLRQLNSTLSDLSMQLEVIRTKYMDGMKNQLDTITEDVKQSNSALAEGLKRLSQTVSQIKG